MYSFHRKFTHFISQGASTAASTGTSTGASAGASGGAGAGGGGGGASGGAGGGGGGGGGSGGSSNLGSDPLSLIFIVQVRLFLVTGMSLARGNCASARIKACQST